MAATLKSVAVGSCGSQMPSRELMATNPAHSDGDDGLGGDDGSDDVAGRSEGGGVEVGECDDGVGDGVDTKCITLPLGGDGKCVDTASNNAGSIWGGYNCASAAAWVCNKVTNVHRTRGGNSPGPLMLHGKKRGNASCDNESVCVEMKSTIGTQTA